METLTTPQNYLEQVEELFTGYSISLQEVVNLMPAYQMNGDTNQSLQKSYLRNANTLQQRMGALENLQIRIQQDSTSLQSQIDRMNTTIELENSKFKLLNQQYNQLLDTNSASKGALFDSQLLYNQQYIGNILLLFVVLCYAKMIYSKYY